MATVGKAMKRIPDVVVVLATLSVACSELVIPEEHPDVLEYRFPSDGKFTALASSPECPAVSTCAIRDDANGEEACVCEVGGITVDGGGAPPAHPITWPEPPGVYWSSNSDGSGGGWRSPGGGGGETCDPNADWPPCFDFEVTLECPAQIERGRTGTCRVSEPHVSLSVVKWYFKGATIENEWSGNSDTWSGTLIESGDVRVDVLLNGTPATVESRITVIPRTTGKFTQSAWAASMEWVELKGCRNYAGTRPHRVIAWAGSYKAAQEGRCAKLRIDNDGEAGYEIDVPQEGPNRFGVYIRNPTWYYKGTSQIHPGRSITYKLTDPEQRSLCWQQMGTISASFNTFNGGCKRVSHWGSFWDAVKKHEKQHWENGRVELMRPENNLYIKTEPCIGPFSALDTTFDDCIIREHVRIQERLRAEAAPEPNARGQIFWAGAGSKWWIWSSDCKPGSSCTNTFGYTYRKF